ncbi:MAG: hypothetical protein CVV64_07425 [Candidatus Wallbacteria bacterium HGW-Wallbacteria-1]|uniref:Uncharacterized protein n=1 Tax=Candidatus Wallbacteria bacterium HGW-Wallbacteria-1 TaxID=2013854 RepID=A0A2N1PQT2_9BACT|nr:MAG: hypothetical protein CVV64_07425 [Candidatus Wallbacteria bacterium HGW-Wallbacteria-1]
MSFKTLILGLAPMSFLTIYLGSSRGIGIFIDLYGIIVAICSLSLLCITTGTGKYLIRAFMIAAGMNCETSKNEILNCIRTVDMMFWAAFAGGVAGFILASALSIPAIGGIPETWMKTAVTALLYGMVAAGFLFLPLKNSLEMHRLRDKINAF